MSGVGTIGSMEFQYPNGNIGGNWEAEVAAWNAEGDACLAALNDNTGRNYEAEVQAWIAEGDARLAALNGDDVGVETSGASVEDQDHVRALEVEEGEEISAKDGFFATILFGQGRQVVEEAYDTMRWFGVSLSDVEKHNALCMAMTEWSPECIRYMWERLGFRFVEPCEEAQEIPMAKAWEKDDVEHRAIQALLFPE